MLEAPARPPPPRPDYRALRGVAHTATCQWTSGIASRGGSDSTLMGDGKVRFDSLYKSQYTGEWASPPNHCHQGLISVVFGDPRCRDAVSEHRHAYSAPHHAPHLCRYDANRAAQQVFQTNIPAGDGRQSFSTTMKEAFQWKDAGPAYASYPDKNMSSILRGDESAQKNKGNMSMSSFYFRELSIKDLKSQKPSSPKSRLAAPLGDRRLGSFSTTQQSDYRQPPQTRRAHVNSADLMKSNIAFNFPDTGISTTTQDMLLPHQLQKHPIPEDLLQKVKHSHLMHPWQGQRWFSTEQREAYTDKGSGACTLVAGGAQLSSVPLGTMKTFRHRPKWPPGSQAHGVLAQSH
uniref:Uncharacterized protein n=1 Tax=Sphaerodactylus townsendi TaxID=933632 RepID=A0ACB8F1M8_9SAUR